MFTSKYLNDLAYSFSWSPSTFSYRNIFHLINPSVYWPSYYMNKPPKARLYHHFFNGSYSNFLSNSCIPHPIYSSVLTHLSYSISTAPSLVSCWLYIAQDSVLHNIKSYNCAANFTFKFKGYFFFITNHTQIIPLFHPPYLDPMIDISLYLPHRFV